jgi:hypothetical protein
MVGQEWIAEIAEVRTRSWLNPVGYATMVAMDVAAASPKPS